MNIDASVAQYLTNGESVALVTLVARTGSAPRHPGARMLVVMDTAHAAQAEQTGHTVPIGHTVQGRNKDEKPRASDNVNDSGYVNGSDYDNNYDNSNGDDEADDLVKIVIEGTIGGGLPEAESIAAARKILRGGVPRLIHFDMTSPSPTADLICGGTISLLIERLDPVTPSLVESFGQATRCLEQGTGGVWTVDITNPATPQRILYPCTKQAPQSLCPCPVPTEPGIITFNERTVYVEPLQPEVVLLLCGGGHVALAAGKLAHEVGFEVDVVDDRAEFASPGRFPFARGAHTLPGFANLAKVCAIGPSHYVVIVTRGHTHDREVLAQVLPTKATYIGMIGSRQKREGVYAALKNQGFTTDDLNRVHCPIGLPIGAETPEEIAVSIVAELIAARRNSGQNNSYLQDSN